VPAPASLGRPCPTGLALDCVNVSMQLCVDTSILDRLCRLKVGWPDAYIARCRFTSRRRGLGFSGLVHGARDTSC
jgi:hypothetical protein